LSGHYEKTASGTGLGESGRRRRHWSDEDKTRIAAECEAPAPSVSIVARRRDLNTNMLFTWRRQFRQRQCGTREVNFLPGDYCAEGACRRLTGSDAEGTAA